jgi:hypothetical protein
MDIKGATPHFFRIWADPVDSDILELLNPGYQRPGKSSYLGALSYPV